MSEQTQRETTERAYDRAREAGIPRDAARGMAREAAEKAHRTTESSRGRR